MTPLHMDTLPGCCLVVVVVHVHVRLHPCVVQYFGCDVLLSGVAQQSAAITGLAGF